MTNKATLICILYEDESADIAIGDTAAEIMEWYNTGQSMSTSHGLVYKGSQFKHYTREEQKNL